MDSRLILPVNTILDGDYCLLRVVGTGGFGITYEAEDIKLGTLVAIKEYYPFDFGERDPTMSVRPRSERHKQPFEKGRANFLDEARTLARFTHPSIVQVTRVFEANSTAYMVMRFERGQSFEAWLEGLGRRPTQDEMDTIAAQLLDALQVMHGANFLHRDIAPDNIIVRDDGTPVLLDFGAARRAVAEMSRSLTGIVKAGYSPHEQYATGGRLQGPWTDIYAFGATLYRAVAGKAPEESTLRVTDDCLVPATEAAKGMYRSSFLAAIDACLRVQPSKRPQSVAQLRPMLLDSKAEPTRTASLREEPAALRKTSSTWRWPAVAAVMVVLAGAYGGLEYQRGTLFNARGPAGEGRETADAAAQRQAAMAAADARQRQAEVEEARRQKELGKAIEAEARRRAEAAASEKRREEEARRKAEAEADARRREELRLAALEEARRDDARRKEDERLRLAAIPDDDKRAEFVRRVQTLLKRNRCYEGAVNGRVSDTQQALNRFADSTSKRGQIKPARIELAKATTGDFEAWLRDADAIRDVSCAPKVNPDQAVKAQRPREAEAQDKSKAPSRTSSDTRPGRGGTCSNWMFYNSTCTDAGGRRCTQTPGGRQCD